MYSEVIENNFKSTALAVNHQRNCTGQSPYLIIKSDYTVIEEWMKISHCLTTKHQVDVFILHHLAMGTNTCFHHPLPIPFSIALSPIPSLLRRSILLHAMMLHPTQGNDLRGDNAVLSLGLVKYNKELGLLCWWRAPAHPIFLCLASFFFSRFSPFSTPTAFFLFYSQTNNKSVSGSPCLGPSYEWTVL